MNEPRKGWSDHVQQMHVKPRPRFGSRRPERWGESLRGEENVRIPQVLFRGGEQTSLLCVCVCWGAGDGGDKVVIVSEEPVCFGVPGNSQTPKGTEEPVEWCSYQVPSKGSLWSLHVCALLAFVVGHSHHETPESGIPHCWVFQRQDKEARASHFPACSSKRYTQVAPSPGWELGTY